MRHRKSRNRLLLSLATCAVVSAVVAAPAAAVSGDSIISTPIGTGTAGFNGDGLAGTSTQINKPRGLAVEPDGTILFSDTDNNRVRALPPGGTVSTIINAAGISSFSGDNGPATAAELRRPFQIARGADGTLFVADAGNHRIRKVDPSGQITTVAGTGSGSSGPDGPLSVAPVAEPWGVAVLKDGRPVFSTRTGHRIWTTSGSQLLTVAGTGTPGFNGDGQATTHQVHHTAGVTTAADGSVYWADYANQRVRKFEVGGAITTVAGDGAADFRGDGGPAITAALNYPQDVAIDLGGNLYIADEFNHAIRKVDAQGTMWTIAGGRSEGFLGDNGPASSSRVASPVSVEVTPDGSLLVATLDDRIRRIQNAQPAAVLSANVLTGPAALTVAFSGAGSSDADGEITSHSWDFGDGATSSEVTPVHTFGAPGTYPVTLTVTDDSGITATVAQNVTVDETGGVAPSPKTPSLESSRCHGQKATIVGTDGHDTIVGTPGPDVIVTGPGNDRVRGLGGNDRICLGSGNDVAVGGPGRDVIKGGTGSDRLIGGPGVDGLSGGKGRDRLYGHSGADVLRGGSQDDLTMGGTGNDIIRSGAGNDRNVGGAGQDRIFGGANRDTLFGNGGRDLLVGEGGRDSAHGGRGSDTCLAESTRSC